MLKIKLFAALAFMVSVACVFLFSDNKSRAQTGKTSERRDEVLERVAGYKGWKQVLKPEKPVDGTEIVAQPVLSTTMGG